MTTIPDLASLTEQDRKSLEGELARRRAMKGICEYATIIDVPGRPVIEADDAEGSEVADTLFAPVESALARHHQIILNALVDMTRIKYGRVMIFMPPGSAKSTYASVVFPSYILGKKPGIKIGLMSYGDDLVRKMGRRTRSIIKQERYAQIFRGATLSADSKAAQEFSLTNGSEYLASGLFTGITGNRFNGAIIDDPVKGRAEANSELIRQKTYDIYVDDVLTRLVPGGWIVIIQTRWHQDDMSGRILPDDWNGQSGWIRGKDGHRWKVICLAAECEQPDTDPLHRQMGEMLWPEWFDEQHWVPFRANSRTWASLFQQRPSPQEGDIFKVENIEVIDALPSEKIRWVRGWDLAATEDAGAYTVGVKMGITLAGKIIVGHVVRVQRGPGRRDGVIVNQANLDGRQVRIGIPQDPGQAGKTQVFDITRKLAGFMVTSSPESGDKVERAGPFASQVNIGNVAMVRGPWNQAYIDELRLFDNGTYKDQVDASSRAFEMLIDRPRMKINEESVIDASNRGGFRLPSGMYISEEAMDDL